MRSPQKYLFDMDFAPGAEASQGKAMIALADHAAQLAEAEAAAYRRGLAAAEAQARSEAERRMAAALDRAAAGLETLGQSLQAVEARLETEAVEVAVAVARKFSAALLAQDPLAEIRALALGCFRHLVRTPHIVVRVAETLLPAAHEKLDAIARAGGFEGRLVVLGEPDIAPGDCRIEWADGGVNRDRAAIDAAIGEVVARYVSARTAAARPNDSNGKTQP